MFWRTLLLVTAGVVLAGAAWAAEPGRLAVQVDKPGVKISPSLYGIFFEEINCAGDGGLYAELVRNRSFEDADKPEHWSLLCTGDAKADMAVDIEKPLSNTNRRSLRLNIQQAGGRVGVANDGWWGIPVKARARYNLSFYARCAGGFSGPLLVSLENTAGKVYAQGKVEGIGGEWKRFTVPLAANATDPKARLVLTATKPGTLWLDVVSLFPRDTFKGRPNGLRPDLAQMLAGLKPSFVRFPGGCWVEGDTLEFSSRWKRTIGDIGDRWNQWNIWQYYSTNGLGFHEYLQMCEDLGAEPLFVINCGMSHRAVVPLDQMQEWVQDALDAIEYANGPTTSKWGALRAKAGHPAPFNLKYLEIGNENGGRAYNERYILFYKAIKARYPQMHLIANTIPGDHPVEIVDEHYYSSPEFFMANAHKYDDYKRDGYKVYVGEYAVTQGCGGGNLRGALGEAAFMTGMERNSDVVVMSSYAPLFVNVNYRRWNPDLIDFDSSRVYGTPSYYVQQMFSRNRGDVVVPIELAAQNVPQQPDQDLKGAIGVGTWLTAAEYKDIKVTQGGKTLFESDFTNGTRGWRLGRGTWKAQDGVLRQSVETEDCRATAGDPSWGDYTYSLKARKIFGAEGFLILFRVRDDRNWIWWNVGGWGNSRTALERCSNGSKYGIGGSAPGGIETGRWYDIRIEVKGPAIRCYLDGKLVTQATDSPQKVEPLYATASRDTAAGEVLVKVVNVTDAEQTLRVELQGAKSVAATGTALVLAGRPEDENSLDAPKKVAPATKALRGLGKSFVHTFPANSVTILRVKAK